MKNELIRRVARLALLTALQIVISRFLSIPTPTVKIGFGFLPIALAGILYGPVAGAAVGGAGDFLGAILFPVGAYFPGFTLSSALVGAVYGLLLHRQTASWARIATACVIIGLALHLGLNTCWLTMITGKGFLLLLPARALKELVLVPVEIVTIRLVANSRILAKTVKF